MQIHEPSPQRDTRTQRQRDRAKLWRALNITLFSVLLLCVVYFMIQPKLNIAAWTVEPHSPHSWLGILTAPLLHGSVEHLAANCISLLILLPLALVTYPRASLWGLPPAGKRTPWTPSKRSSLHMMHNGWLARHRWFEQELVPLLQARVAEVIGAAD